MAIQRRDRARRPGRRPPFRDPKPIILIVCEGEITEPEYFEGFWRACQNPRVTVKIADDHGVPKTLVEIAKELKNEALARAKQECDDNLAFDSVWCVYDVDDHPNLHEAREMAAKNGIELAISNPCFELWLLLHFRDNPGMQHRDKLAQLLKKFDPAYDKHVDYATYEAGYEDAVTHARRMNQSAENRGDFGGNPSTRVYLLTEQIRGDEQT